MKYLKKRLDLKVGRPPGDLTFYGEEEKSKTNITMYSYDSKNFSAKEIGSIQDLHEINEENVNWIDIEGFQDVGLIKAIGNYLIKKYCYLR